MSLLEFTAYLFFLLLTPIRLFDTSCYLLKMPILLNGGKEMKKQLFMVVLICLLSVQSAIAAKEINIGLMCPLTGAYASEGQDMNDIVTILADELNANGGLLGKKVNVIVGDDGSDARNSSMAAQRLTTQDVIVSIGTYGSANTEVTQNIYDESKIIQIANGSTSVRLSEKGLNYFFRTCPRDDSQGDVAYKTLLKLGYKKIAILHDNSSYAKGLADEAMAPLKKNGADIVFYDALTPKENDYTAILTKMKSVNPDVVFFTGYYGEAGLLLRQKTEMGWNVPFVGGDATNNQDLVKIAGKKAAKDFLCLSPPLPQDLMNPQAKSFMDKFTKKYNRLPGSIWSVLAGDGFKVATAAIKATKSTDPDVLADYMHTKMKNVEGLTGKISFNEKGDRIGDVYRVYIVDASGKFVLQP